MTGTIACFALGTLAPLLYGLSLRVRFYLYFQFHHMNDQKLTKSCRKSKSTELNYTLPPISGCIARHHLLQRLFVWDPILPGDIRSDSWVSLTFVTASVATDTSPLSDSVQDPNDGIRSIFFRTVFCVVARVTQLDHLYHLLRTQFNCRRTDAGSGEQGESECDRRNRHRCSHLVGHFLWRISDPPFR